FRTGVARNRGARGARFRTTIARMSCHIPRLLPFASLVLCAALAAPVPAAAQGKSGPRALDACALVTKAELDAALGRPVQPKPVPASTPATLGVSICMW